MKQLLLILCISSATALAAQTNIQVSNPQAELVLKGQYAPATYTPTNILKTPSDIVPGIRTRVSSDTLEAWLKRLQNFENRNTGSDTISATKGIGAARRWALSKFKQFSSANENRLLCGYLQFDQSVCGMGHHRNVIAVLPGLDTANHRVIIIEAHMDSRCDVGCDTGCFAPGADDNGSGTVLVMELARVMSRYAYDHTIMFMLTTGEEQGLVGATAAANWFDQNDIDIKGVWNNDVVGGVICGKSSSPPSCEPAGSVDSTSVRIFSAGYFYSPNKNMARWIKLEVNEELNPILNVPMKIRLMLPEDRTGRGGDHIPFRQLGYTSVRFTETNENGDAGVGANYHDHQHTSDDIIGVDHDMNGIIDTYWVDFHYLARNTMINGVTAGLAAIGPPEPTFTTSNIPGNVIVQVDPSPYNQFRVGIRSDSVDFDWVYTMNGTLTDTFYAGGANKYYVTVAAVDALGVESFFGEEQLQNILGTSVQDKEPNVSIYPNPTKGSVFIQMGHGLNAMDAHLDIYGALGQWEARIAIPAGQTTFEVPLAHLVPGPKTYCIRADHIVLNRGVIILQ